MHGSNPESTTLASSLDLLSFSFLSQMSFRTQPENHSDHYISDCVMNFPDLLSFSEKSYHENNNYIDLLKILTSFYAPVRLFQKDPGELFTGIFTKCDRTINILRRHSDLSPKRLYPQHYNIKHGDKLLVGAIICSAKDISATLDYLFFMCDHLTQKSDDKSQKIGVLISLGNQAEIIEDLNKYQWSGEQTEKLKRLSELRIIDVIPSDSKSSSEVEDHSKSSVLASISKRIQKKPPDCSLLRKKKQTQMCKKYDELQNDYAKLQESAKESEARSAELEVKMSDITRWQSTVEFYKKSTEFYKKDAEFHKKDAEFHRKSYEDRIRSYEDRLESFENREVNIDSIENFQEQLIASNKKIISLNYEIVDSKRRLKEYEGERTEFTQENIVPEEKEGQIEIQKAALES